MSAHPPAPPPAVPAARGRNWMLWLVVGIFAAYLGTNGVMFWFASETPPLLVSKTYYEDSRRYDAVQNAEQATAAAGWRVQAEPAAPGELRVTITDRAGRPASGFSGEASAYRPNDAALDQPLSWSEEPAAPGHYRAHFAKPRAGQWQLKLALRRGGERIVEDMRVVTP